jgi:bisphosphoglycerate-independent phosphoglycerate mutase (AlkP superfamily)
VTPELNSLAIILDAKDSLADIAPTVLELAGIPKPEEMTGHSLLPRLK